MDQHFSRQRKDSRPSRPAATGKNDARGGRRDAPHAHGAERTERAGRNPAPARRKDDRREAEPQRGDRAPARGRDAAGKDGGPLPVRRSAVRGRADADDKSRPPRRQDVTPAAAKHTPAKPAAGKDLYPQAEFARREGMLEGMPAVMLVNRSLKGYAFRKDFPWCLRLVVAYRADDTSGLPLPKEERVLEAFEQNLFGLLKRSVNGHYIGYTSWRGSREFLFYVDEGSEVEDPLNAFAQSKKRELEFALENDPQWKHAAHYFDYRD